MANWQVISLDTTTPQLRAPGTGDGYSFNSGSTQLGVWTTTGLGIGTASPGARLHSVIADGSYQLAVSGTTKGARFETNATETRLVGVDNTLTASFQPLSIGGSTVIVRTNGTTQAAIFDSSGNLGLGVTPSAWESGQRAFDFGLTGTIKSNTSAGSVVSFGNNCYYGSSSWRYKQSSQAAALYDLRDTGEHRWYTAPSGTAGNAITFTQALTLDANVNLLLNGTTAPASGVGTFAIFNGTAPTGSVTNGCVLYTEDVSSSSELKVRDEAGNVTTLSPHNFSLIPEGASEDMAWAYYSEKNGKRINVDMLKLARMVEKLTGEKLVYEA